MAWKVWQRNPRGHQNRVEPENPQKTTGASPKGKPAFPRASSENATIASSRGPIFKPPTRVKQYHQAMSMLGKRDVHFDGRSPNRILPTLLAKPLAVTVALVSEDDPA